jgi:serine protease Do
MTLPRDSEAGVLSAKNKVAPALVHIRPVKEIYTGGRREEIVTIGSGFIISPDGYVITNEHVAGESAYVHCVLSTKEEVEAEVVGVDAYTDVALLKLPTDQPLPYVKLGDSSALEAGVTVMALGSPHGLARSVSLGIISVTERYLDSRGDLVAPFNNWLQTDAAINPGNSGGPLVNLRGEVVGVNSRVLIGAENVGFAIPINVVKEVVGDLKEYGRVRRSSVGITLQEMQARTSDASQRGVVIADVDPLSPAAQAKVLPGDVLLKINGLPTDARFEEDLPALRNLVASLPIGKPAILSVQRAGETVDIAVTTEALSGIKGIEREFSEWQFTASDITPEIARRAQLATRHGILISGTQVGGLAAESGVQVGDIVLKVDDVVVQDLDHFRNLYAERVASGQRLVLLFVKGGAITRFVMVEQSGEPVPTTQPVEAEAPAEPEEAAPDAE